MTDNSITCSISRNGWTNAGTLTTSTWPLRQQRGPSTVELAAKTSRLKAVLAVAAQTTAQTAAAAPAAAADIEVGRGTVTAETPLMQRLTAETMAQVVLDDRWRALRAMTRG